MAQICMAGGDAHGGLSKAQSGDSARDLTHPWSSLSVGAPRLLGHALSKSLADGQDGQRPTGQARAGSSGPFCRRQMRIFDWDYCVPADDSWPCSSKPGTEKDESLLADGPVNSNLSLMPRQHEMDSPGGRERGLIDFWLVPVRCRCVGRRRSQSQRWSQSKTRSRLRPTP
jgi:hypothetical protein